MGTRWLIKQECSDQPLQTAARYNRILSKYPQALQYTEEEVAEFTATIAAMEQGPHRDQIADYLPALGIRLPRQIRSDRYQMLRYVLRRWPDPTVREKLKFFRRFDPSTPALRAALSGDLQPLAEDKDHIFPWPLLNLAILKEFDRADLIPAYKEALPPLRKEFLAANLAFGRYLMLKCIHGLPGRERQLTPGEQRQIIQRIRKRELQLQSMRHNLYAMRQERKALTARLRETDLASRTELNNLIAELDRLQQALAEAEREHAAALAALAEKYRERTAALEAVLAPIQHDFAAALAERNQWAPATMLNGLTVSIIGDDGRADGYRALIESAGGKLIHVSALEKFSRIPEAIAPADVVIVMTAIAKHQAEHRLKKAAKPGAILLRCAKAGLGALERLLQVDLLPRLSLAQVAQARSKGGEARA